MPGPNSNTYTVRRHFSVTVSDLHLGIQPYLTACRVLGLVQSEREMPLQKHEAVEVPVSLLLSSCGALALLEALGCPGLKTEGPIQPCIPNSLCCTNSHRAAPNISLNVSCASLTELNLA